MAALNILLLQDTQYLLTAYNTRPTFRKMFDDLVKKKTRVVFRSRPLKIYVYAMITISPKYEYYRNQIRQDQSKISELFKEYYLDPKSGIRLIEQSINNPSTPTISSQDHSEINRIEQLPPRKEKILTYEKFLEDKDKEKKESPPAGSGRPQIPQEVLKKILKEEPLAETNLPRPQFKIPNSLKNISSQGQILVKRGGINAVRGIGGMFKGAGRNLLGGGAKLGTGALQFGGRGLVAAGAAIGGSVGAPIIVAVLVVLGVLIVGPLLMNLLENESFLPPFQQNVSTAEAAGITNISSCQFYRGNQNPPAVSYQSPLLLSYFQEAEKLSSVPAVLLAAVARVESPGVTNFTDDQVINYTCAKSDTGARGIMQLQPPGTTGSVRVSLNQGAKFLGKTVDQLTEADFCDPRKSIIIAAGFILNKLTYYGDGDGTKWDPVWANDPKVINKIAESYYGCLEYGTSEKTATGTTKCAGPYNYGTDLWNSLQNCQAISLAEGLGCPVAGQITAPYGYNIPGYPANAPENVGCSGLSACHSAIDIAAPEGSPVISPINGVVTEVSSNKDRGRYMTILNTATNYSVLMAHLKDVKANPADIIIKGQLIATVGIEGEGSTGPHLHYRLLKNSQTINPLRYLGTSASIGNSSLASSDDIKVNDYSKTTGASFGQCNTSP